MYLNLPCRYFWFTPVGSAERAKIRLVVDLSMQICQILASDI
jgi:hypothetical protein